MSTQFPPWRGSVGDNGGQGLRFWRLPCLDLIPRCPCSTPCTMAVGAISVADLEVPPAPALLAASIPCPTAAGPRGASARSQARGCHGSLGAGRGSAAGANPPACRPAQHLAGHPSKTVRHRFPVGSPLRQTNLGSLNLPSKSPAGRRAGGREGAAAGLRRPGGKAGAITTLSFFRLILTSHFNLIEPCLASRLLARRVRGLGPDAAGR